MFLKVLRCLFCAELVWIVFDVLSPWHLRWAVGTFVLFTMPWIILILVAHFVKKRWNGDGNAALGCLYTVLWLLVLPVVLFQLFMAWPVTAAQEEVVYRDSKYQVIIYYGILATNTDNVGIDELCGPFRKPLYYGCLCDVDTDKLKSPKAIDVFLNIHH